MDRLLEDTINVIQFMDLLCLSILMPSVPPTILKSGGTLLHLGFVMSASAALRMISSNIYTELMKITGKRHLLKYSLIGNLILNAALLTTSTASGIILNRLSFVLVNQVPMLCAQLANKDEKDQGLHKNPQVQRLASALLGLATVGSLIDSKGGFYLLVGISTFISGGAVAFVLQVASPEKEKEQQLTPLKALEVIPKTFQNAVAAMKNTDIHFANWDALLIKFLLITNATTVFILYVVLIIVVFRGNGATVCTTAAFQTIVITLSGIVFTKLKGPISQLFNSKDILEKSLITCAVCAVILGFSPTYSFYLFMFVPFIIARTFVENYYVEVFELKQNQKLGKDIKTVTEITSVVSPLFIGLLFYLLTYNAYRILAVVPFIGIYYIVKNKGCKKVKAEKISEEKKNDNPVKANKDK